MRSVLAVAGCLLMMATVSSAQESSKNSKVAVGKPAPDFAVTGIDGTTMKLSDLTDKGKNVVLLFDRAHW